MPNAQTHLASVCSLIEYPAVPSWLASDESYPAFLLGSISPDVRIFSGQPREETHFFELLPEGLKNDIPPQEAMLHKWAGLADVGRLTRPQAAFVAGYITHLIMDYVWVTQVVMDGLFIAEQAWGPDHPNWWQYSLLMTYLEYNAAAAVPPDAAVKMAECTPDHWLPFVEDRHLIAWRDHVSRRIINGGPRLISEMFARSNNLTPGELEQIIASSERMGEEVFCIIPESRLSVFQQETTDQCIAFLIDYLPADSAGREGL